MWRLYGLGRTDVAGFWSLSDECGGCQAAAGPVRRLSDRCRTSEIAVWPPMDKCGDNLDRLRTGATAV